MTGGRAGAGAGAVRRVPLGFDVNDTANAHKLAELNTKSFTIVTTSKALVVMGSLEEVRIRFPHGARYVTEAKHADGRTVYVDTSGDPSDKFGKFWKHPDREIRSFF
eukprot:COSAG01_NODE_19_length_39011_cov_38.134968_28_plen_107_part_00